MTKYYEYTLAELERKAKINLDIYDNEALVFEQLADKMLDVIKANNANSEETVIICPVGPVGHYPYFVEKVNTQQISLAKVWFLNMDEHLTDDLKAIDETSDLSFTGFMKREVYGKIKEELLMPETQRIFPEADNLEHIPAVIEAIGKVDLCIGGIGINGHLAFNEPKPDWTIEELLNHPTHVGEIAAETITISAMGNRQGALELIPKHCVTIGMKEIYAAKEICLGVFRDWHPAVVKRAVCGKVTTRFPVTLLQNHPHASILAPKPIFKV